MDFGDGRLVHSQMMHPQYMELWDVRRSAKREELAGPKCRAKKLVVTHELGLGK